MMFWWKAPGLQFSGCVAGGYHVCIITLRAHITAPPTFPTQTGRYTYQISLRLCDVSTIEYTTEWWHC